jgi:hypothetical protein
MRKVEDPTSTGPAPRTQDLGVRLPLDVKIDAVRRSSILPCFISYHVARERAPPSTCISLARTGVVAELFRYASDQCVQS